VQEVLDNKTSSRHGTSSATLRNYKSSRARLMGNTKGGLGITTPLLNT